MKYCDLHNHSVYSDGSLTPYELVSYAKEKGVSAIGLTDHNTVSALADFEKACKEVGIEYVFGSELTTECFGKEVHLLCLFITEKNKHRVESFTKKQLENKMESNIDLAKNLQKGGYNISIEELAQKFGKSAQTINRAHFARFLVDKGYVESTDVGFDTVLKSGNGFYNPPQRLDLIEVVKLVREWGCVPVIAHPLLSISKEELENILPKAKEAGLVGMEVYYPKFTQAEQEYLAELCQRHILIASGGSDYHGSMKSQGDLNDAKAPYTCYEQLLSAFKKINEKR